jgi:ABC-2 type transport system ATP-binding protein
MLDIRNLSKRYDSFSLGSINLQLKAGTVYGLVGANGAGKTTFFRTVMGTVRSDTGQISVKGNVVRNSCGQWKQDIGYVGDYTPLFENRSGFHNLKMFSHFYKNWSSERASFIANRFDLDLHQKVKNYSTGQRTKLAITLALSHQPKLLLFDEPATGLDPVSRETFIEMLFEEIEHGNKTILYATQHVSEIEQLADEIIFLNSGQILRQDMKEDLVEHWRRITFRKQGDVGEIPNCVSLKTYGLDFELVTDDHKQALCHLEQSQAESIEVSRLSVEQISVQILKQTVGDRHAWTNCSN